MLKESLTGRRVFIAAGYTDMRRGIDGLAAIVSEDFGLDPFTEPVYLFCVRRSDRIKCLWWERDGFVLAYKRLESAGTFKWPRSQREAKTLSGQQVRWLLEGLEIEQKKAIQPTYKLSLF